MKTGTVKLIFKNEVLLEKSEKKTMKKVNYYFLISGSWWRFLWWNLLRTQNVINTGSLSSYDCSKQKKYLLWFKIEIEI